MEESLDKQLTCVYEEVKIKCLYLDTPQSQMQQWKIIQQYDAGAEGIVYLVQGEDSKSYILKISKDMKPLALMESTICNQNLCNLFGMAPKIVAFWKCGGEGEKFRRVYIMDKAGDMTLQTYFLLLKKEENLSLEQGFAFLKTVIQIHFFILLMSCIGIFHTDYHWGNVMLSYKDGEPSDPQIIDFDRSIHYGEIMRDVKGMVCDKNLSIKDFYKFANKMKTYNVTYISDQYLFFANPAFMLKDHLEGIKSETLRNIVEYIIEIGGDSVIKSLSDPSEKKIYSSEESVTEMVDDFIENIDVQMSAFEERKYGGYDEEFIEKITKNITDSLKSFFKTKFVPAYKKYLALTLTRQ